MQLLMLPFAYTQFKYNSSLKQRKTGGRTATNSLVRLAIRADFLDESYPVDFVQC